MKIIKRNGKEEEFNYEKIKRRIAKATYQLSDIIDPDKMAIKIANGCYDGITTLELDTLAYETAASLITDHPDYSLLASRLAITTMRKDTKKNFSDVIEDLHG